MIIRRVLSCPREEGFKSALIRYKSSSFDYSTLVGVAEYEIGGSTFVQYKGAEHENAPPGVATGHFKTLFYRLTFFHSEAQPTCINWK